MTNLSSTTDAGIPAPDSTQRDRQTSWLQRLLVTRSRALFLIVVVGGSIAAIVWKDEFAKETGEILVAVATSLLAAAIFAVVHSWLLDRVHNAIVEDELRTLRAGATAAFELHAQRMAAGLANDVALRMNVLQESTARRIIESFHTHIPSETFPASTVPNAQFNSRLREELSSTLSYSFKGITGRHVADNMAFAKSVPECRVMLLDPSATSEIRLYVRHRFGIVDDETTEKKIKLVRKEILGSIVALARRSRSHPVEIAFHRGPTFYRSESTDSVLFLSYYSPSMPTGYPATFLFRKGTVHFDAFRADARHTWETASRRALLAGALTDDAIAEQFAKLELGPDQIESMLRAVRDT